MSKRLGYFRLDTKQKKSIKRATTGRRVLYAALFVALTLATCLILRVYLPVSSFISTEVKKEAIQELSSQILFSGEIDRNHFDGWGIITTTRDVRDLVEFDNRYLAATSGGLVVLDYQGHRDQVYTNLNGLLSNDLTAFAIYKDKLFIGSKKGLMSLYSGNLTCYEVESVENVTCLAATEEFLYVGTLGAGVVRFDGQRFMNDLNLAKGSHFENVTAIACSPERLVIGTYDKGLFISEQGGFVDISTDGGLLSPNIRAVAMNDTLICVGTPYGVDIITERLRIKNLLTDRFVNAVTFGDDFSLFGTFDDGIYRRGKNYETHQLSELCINYFSEVGGERFALTDDGIYLLKQQEWVPFYVPESEEISSNHITTLGFDRARRVWIGTFEDGINVLSGEHVSKRMGGVAVNHISMDDGSGRMWVSTARGVITNQRMLNMKDGLIGNNVAHVGTYGGQAVFATNRGITLYEDGAFRSLYAFHGLINNHAYTSEQFDGKLYIGTLGGISVLHRKKVVANLTTANSGLPANWVTALKKVGDWLYIGTYGGGICRVNKYGKWESLGFGSVEANLNAVCYDEPYLLWGTLDRGVLAYNVRTAERQSIVRPLASPNVTSITVSDERLFVGTENGLSFADREKYLKREEAGSRL